MSRRLLLFCVFLALLLAGCRTRTIDDPEQADVVLPLEQTTTAALSPEPARSLEPSPAPSPEPVPTPESTPSPPPEPVSAPEAEPTPIPEGEPEPTGTANAALSETAESSKPDQASVIDPTGAAQLREQPRLGITVTYDANGGDGPPVSTSVTEGQPYGIQPTAARRGFAFCGWWTNPVGGSQIFPETVVTETEPHTLYAHWEKKGTNTVTFDGNGGRVKSKEAKLELSEGDRYGTMPVPLREGYNFSGWFTSREDGLPVAETDVFPGGDLTLYAQWEYDPFAFWSFTLKNRTQQVYLCQQTSIYFETETDGVTTRNCALITDTGSQNIAENRDEPNVTDDWVLAKKPRMVIKKASDPGAAGYADLAARFPEQEIAFVTAEALGNGPAALCAKLSLAKHLYSEWYEDVDLSVVAQELGVSEIPIYF